ncbi:MAG: TldD/PmbA family protein [Asgard group archaeon]|nr:TldD/PmbA family protein [Asgard group archaeon]
MKFDALKDELLALADTGLKYAKNQGADHAEIYVSSQNNIKVTNQMGIIDARDGLNEGIGVSVALGKKIGFAAMSSLTDKAMKYAVTEAITLAKSVTQENVDFVSYPAKQKPAKDGIIDNKIVSISTEDIVNMTNEIFNDAKNFDKRIVSASANTQTFYGGHAVANSEGISAASKATGFVIISNVTAMEGSQRKSSFDFSVTRTIPKEITIGSNCAEKAIKLFNSKPLNHTGVLPTVWNQLIMSNFWQISLIQSINGRQVVEKNSYFMDKLGDQVGIKELKITDDGQLPEGVNTGEIDDEGVPRRTTKIVENGVLRSFLYDNYYGRLGKAESTGNASRGQSYESTPGISPTTIVIQPGSKTQEELIAEIDKGIFVTDNVMGLGHSNLISGDFSVVATNAYLIEKGEIAYPLDSIQIAGNLYKSYKDITHIGSDSKLLPSVKTPSIMFDSFTING